MNAGSAAPERPSSAASPPVALYIHVPFCVSLCPYCDFVVYAGAAARGSRARVDALVRALRTEIDLRADHLDEAFGRPRTPRTPRSPRAPLETVYLGGGTPSLLPTDTVAALLELVRARFGLDSEAEVTIEANPGPDERGDARGLREAGITRVSLGAQSMSDPELRRLGRRHRAEDVVAGVAAARAAGIGSVSLDLLYDIPGSSLAGWSETLDTALALEPDHLSLYALTLDDPDEEGLTGPTGDHLPTTAGARRWRDGARPAQDEDRAAEQYLHAVERLGAAGWRGYEISNWARPGHESRHNLVYWQRRPYEAVGPGAHAFDGVARRWNAARLDGYLAALGPPDGAAPRLPPGGSEVLDPERATAEGLILGLRTDHGVGRQTAGDPRFDDAFRWAITSGLAVVTDTDRVVLTTRGRLLSNELFARLV
ncbi:MAG TPA: radical SAM family heme chaperone HemW [Candidatus Limnocylindrales bacterium]|nr:radical SAM family heme chaperone HemW [Candidatus Limnocylindrales bacterium]